MCGKYGNRQSCSRCLDLRTNTYFCCLYIRAKVPNPSYNWGHKYALVPYHVPDWHWMKKYVIIHQRQIYECEMSKAWGNKLKFSTVNNFSGVYICRCMMSYINKLDRFHWKQTDPFPYSASHPFNFRVYDTTKLSGGRLRYNLECVVCKHLDAT
jgi:hypothetical protein